MKREKVLKHEFVEFIPDHLKEGTIYISISFATASHKCCCGCGAEVVTPITPTDWKLVYNGISVSLDPSIGNWNFKCQSHYWIRNNRVSWASKWSQEKIAAGRNFDQKSKEAFYHSQPKDAPIQTKKEPRGRLSEWIRKVSKKTFG